MIPPLCTQNLSKLVHAVHEKCTGLVAMTVISSLRCDGHDIVKFQEEKGKFTVKHTLLDIIYTQMKLVRI